MVTNLNPDNVDYRHDDSPSSGEEDSSPDDDGDGHWARDDPAYHAWYAATFPLVAPNPSRVARMPSEEQDEVSVEEGIASRVRRRYGDLPIEEATGFERSPNNSDWSESDDSKMGSRMRKASRKNG